MDGITDARKHMTEANLKILAAVQGGVQRGDAFTQEGNHLSLDVF